MHIIDGKSLAASLREDIKQNVEKLKSHNIVPGLAVVLVGNNPASAIYVRNKVQACEETGIYSRKYTLDESTDEQSLLNLLAQLNQDDRIDGILVQLPLPNHINEAHIIDAISEDKDVDGFSPRNMGNLFIGKDAFEPCTPKGCLALLKTTGISLEGKKAVVIGRSNIVGKPMAMLLLQENATVTICHSKTKDIRETLKDADIIVVAVGKKAYLKPDMVQDGAVVIDVGINRDEHGKVVGDVDFKAFAEQDKDVFITPVPGGVGPMTITMLLANTLESAKRRHGIYREE